LAENDNKFATGVVNQNMELLGLDDIRDNAGCTVQDKSINNLVAGNFNLVKENFSLVDEMFNASKYSMSGDENSFISGVTDCDDVGGKVEEKYDDGPVIGLANERCYHGDRNNYQSKHFSHLGFREEDDFHFEKQAELFMNSSLEVESHVPINVGNGKGKKQNLTCSHEDSKDYFFNGLFDDKWDMEKASPGMKDAGQVEFNNFVMAGNHNQRYKRISTVGFVGLNDRVVEYSTDQAYNSETPARHSSLMERRRRDISVTDLEVLTRYTSKCRDDALAALGCSWKQEDDPKGLAGDSSLYTTEEVRNMENNCVLMVGTSEPSCPGWENFPYSNLPWNEVELDLVRGLGKHLPEQEEDRLWLWADVVLDIKEIVRNPSMTSVDLNSLIMSNKRIAMNKDKSLYHKWPNLAKKSLIKTANQFPKKPEISPKPPPTRCPGTAPTSSPCSTRTPPSCSTTPPLSPQSTWRCAAEPDMLGLRTRPGLWMTSFPGTGRVGRRPSSPPWSSSRG
jgi:hypothetical protein